MKYTEVYNLLYKEAAKEGPVGYYAGVDKRTSTPTHIYWNKWEPSTSVDSVAGKLPAIDASKASYMPENARLLRYDKAVPEWRDLSGSYSMQRVDVPGDTLRGNLNKTIFAGANDIPAPSMQTTGNYNDQKAYLESLRGSDTANKAVDKALDAMEMTKAQYKFYREWLKATGGKSQPTK